MYVVTGQLGLMHGWCGWPADHTADQAATEAHDAARTHTHVDTCPALHALHPLPLNFFFAPICTPYRRSPITPGGKVEILLQPGVAFGTGGCCFKALIPQ